MEVSPLSQQTRPDTWKPKVVDLYEELFQARTPLKKPCRKVDRLQDEHFEQSEGFWRELFLLRPEQSALQRILADLSADALLHHEIPTQDLFQRATEYITAGEGPGDENALDTLTVFLESVLGKKYANPSSDIISVLCGLEGADTALTGFVSSLDVAVRHGRTLDVRRKAVRAIIAAVAGAYQTGLVVYFINKDLFPALMKLIQDADDPVRIFAPCALLGLLANYNKFEFQNPYQMRLEDFVNEQGIRKVCEGLSETLITGRDAYLEIQDDVPDGWDISSTLSYVGLGRLANPSAPVLNEEDAKAAFASLPRPESSILLAMYDFANANKVFAVDFVSPSSDDKTHSPAIDSFLTFSSYLFHNAHRSSRATLYSHTCLLILRILIEDPNVAKLLCSVETTSQVRLCRQRQPLLPSVRGNRLRVNVVFDVIIDGINHNLRRRLDTELYVFFLDPLLRLLTFLGISHIHLVYRWADLWRCLLSLMKFLNSYAETLKSLVGIDKLVDRLVDVLALALSNGEQFLPDARSYDDLFYKVFESGEALTTFRDNFGLAKRTTSSSLDVLINVSSHYTSLLEERKSKGLKSMSTREITKMIKEGYETLSIQAKEGLGHWERYREADHKNLIKRITRMAVQDMKILLAERT